MGHRPPHTLSATGHTVMSGPRALERRSVPRAAAPRLLICGDQPRLGHLAPSANGRRPRLSYMAVAANNGGHMANACRRRRLPPEIACGVSKLRGILLQRHLPRLLRIHGALPWRQNGSPTSPLAVPSQSAADGLSQQLPSAATSLRDARALTRGMTKRCFGTSWPSSARTGNAHRKNFRTACASSRIPFR